MSTNSLNRRTLITWTAIGAAFGAGYCISNLDAGSIASGSQDRTAQPEGRGMDIDAGQVATGDSTWRDDDLAALMQAWEKAFTPGPQHEHLETFIGTFDGKVTMQMTYDSPPSESTGSATREWILDKRWLQEKVEATSEWGEFQGLGLLGYSNLDGQYQSIWLDSMSTASYIEAGVFDAERKVFYFFGNHRTPTGENQVNYSEIDVSDPDRHTMTGWTVDAQGRRFKSFEGVFERRKE